MFTLVFFFILSLSCDNYTRGTFSKRSRFVTGRRPLGRDERLDYDYDSEAEWEEGDDPDGETIHR